MLNWAARPVPDRGADRPDRAIPENPFKSVERPKAPAPGRRRIGPEGRRAFLAFRRPRAGGRAGDGGGGAAEGTGQAG